MLRPRENVRIAARLVVVGIAALSVGACSSHAPTGGSNEARTEGSAETPEVEPVRAELIGPETIRAEPVGAGANPEPPAPPITLSHAERLRLIVLLRNGRRAAASDDATSALMTFRQALEIDPHHPALLCEAGAAALTLGDPQALAYLEEGARTVSLPALRAACSAQLGRALEAEGSEEAALAAYRTALGLRPRDADVAARARALEAYACPPAGPFAHLEEACAATGDTSCTVSPIEGAEGWVTVSGSAVSGSAGRYLAQRGGTALAMRLGRESEATCATSRLENLRGEVGDALTVITFDEVTEYRCVESPWERCLADASLPTECDGVTAAAPPETTRVHRRVLCAAHEGEMRCSLPSEAAEDAPLPHGAALERLLLCPR